MKAIIYDQFQGPLRYEEVADPVPDKQGVVLEVGATGLCRSDWHGWMGHDSDIILPHVPGHELAGKIVALGSDVQHWKRGDRVTLPFVCGCGNCPQCQSGNQQVCDHQFQPGFTHWGSFAKYVAINYADQNLVRLPDAMSFTTAASLGCRFITAYRGLVARGGIMPNDWVAVHGCGGVGTSSIMIAKSFNANVIAVDIDNEKLDFAKSIGADYGLNASEQHNIIDAIKDISDGGVHISIDALGSHTTCVNSIRSLRKRGKHIQIGLLPGKQGHPKIPMDIVISNELEILGSHGMQAHKYPEMLVKIESRILKPDLLIGNTVHLTDVVHLLPDMHHFSGSGVSVINKFN